MGSVQPTICILILISIEATAFIPPPELEQGSGRLDLLEVYVHGSSKITSEKETFVDTYKSGYFNFRDKSFKFVDKSMLITYFLDNIVSKGNPLAVTAPARWGKTVNAEMIKDFFQVPRDKNGVALADKKQCRRYQKFQELDIGKKTELMPANFGTRDVVKLDYGFLSMFTDVNDFVGELGVVVQTAIQYHDLYLCHLLKTDPLVQPFYKTCVLNWILTVREAKLCVLKLIEVLYRNNNRRRVLVIIDEISAPFQRILRLNTIKDSDAKLMTEIIGGFTGDIIKQNNLVWTSFLTGIMQFGETYSEYANNLVYLSIFNDNDLLKFYGFTTSDVDQVTEKLDDAKKNMVQELFDGYQSYDSKIGSMFCPGGVLRYIEFGAKQLSRDEKEGLFLGSNLEVFSNLLSLEKYGKTVWDSIMTNNPIDIRIKQKLLFKDLLMLRQAEEYGKRMDGTAQRLFFYMMESGFFTATRDGILYKMRCPNTVARSVMEAVIIKEEYYRTKLKITFEDTERFRQCIKELKGTYESVKNLTESIKGLNVYAVKKSVLMQEQEMSSMFYSFLFQSDYFDVNSEYFVQKPAKNDSFHEIAILPRDKPAVKKGKKGEKEEKEKEGPIYGTKIDVLAIRGDQVGVLIENKFHTSSRKKKKPTPEEALEVLLERNYLRVFKTRGLKKFILVGVVLTDDELSCSVLANSTDLKDKVTFSLDRPQRNAQKTK